MKMNLRFQTSLIASLALASLIGTAGNTMPLPAKLKKTPVAAIEKPTTPEITTAETRVSQAKAQVEVTSKQLNASKALLRAAQADLKAAEADLSALQLKAEAQGLVDETGMTPAKAAPVAVASSVKKEEEATTENSDDSRIKTDFNAEQNNNNNPSIQLR